MSTVLYYNNTTNYIIYLNPSLLLSRFFSDSSETEIQLRPRAVTLSQGFVGVFALN